MNLPFDYDRIAAGEFGGTTPTTTDFEHARVVILPVPLDRTTSYVAGTRNGPHEILMASSHMELWDEEVGADVHGVGIFTLPAMELPFGELSPLMDEIRRVATEVLSRDKFLVTLGGEHSITPPLVAAAAARFKGLSVLQIDAHADLRDCYMGTPHNHACAMRRSRCVGFVATGLPTAESIGTSAELSEKAQDRARSMPSCSAYSRRLLAFSFSASSGVRTRPVATWSLNSSLLQMISSNPKCKAIGRIVKSSVPVTRTLR